VEKSLGQTLRTLCTDNGGEFTSGKFEEYLKKEEIKHELTIPKCPQQNGVAERLNRKLVEIIRLMLVDLILPKSFWAEALATVVYLQYCNPTGVLEGKIPFEALFGVKPKVGHLLIRVFACTAYPLIPKDERQKLDDNAGKCIFAGYSTNRKGYHLCDQSSCRILHT